MGGDAKLFQHASHIAALAVHGIDDGDALVHQLRQVFVPAADHHIHAARSGQHGQGADHVIGLHARHIEHLHAQEAHHFVDRRNLGAQIVGHGRALGFVSGVNRVSKGRALGVKHAGHVGGGHFFAQGLHHVHHTAQRAGGGAGRVARHGAQVGHGMKGTVQVAGAVNQQQSRRGSGGRGVHGGILPACVGAKGRRLQSRPVLPRVCPCLGARTVRTAFGRCAPHSGLLHGGLHPSFL